MTMNDGGLNIFSTLTDMVILICFSAPIMCLYGAAVYFIRKGLSKMKTANKKSMTYKEFIKWCNEVPADCLTSTQAIHILAINTKLSKTPWFRRKKVWEEINVRGFVEKGLVKAVNNTIARRKK